MCSLVSAYCALVRFLVPFTIWNALRVFLLTFANLDIKSITKHVVLQRVLLLLSGPLFITVFTQMLSTVHCREQPAAPGVFILDSSISKLDGMPVWDKGTALHVRCYEEEHIFRFLLALYAILFYFPTSCISPFGYDAQFTKKSLDIRMVHFYGNCISNWSWCTELLIPRCTEQFAESICNWSSYVL